MQAILPAVLVFAVTFAILAIALSRAAGGRSGARRLAAVTKARPQQPAAPSEPIAGRPDVIPWVTRLLSGTRMQRWLQTQIIQAGLLLRPSELLVLVGLGACVGGLGGFVFGQAVWAAPGALLLGSAPWVYIKIQQARRKKRLTQQLPDALDLMCASLRAGYGFVQALGTVANEMASPLRDEARRLVDEVRLGLSIEAALQRMIERTGTPDFELMCSAVQIQTRTGGNLAEVLGNLSEVIRARVRLAGEVAALTAEGRLSAVILLALPFAFAGILSYLSPGYLRPLLIEPLGQILLGTGSVLMGVGAVLIHRMLQLDL